MAVAAVPSDGSRRSMMLRKISVSVLGQANYRAAEGGISRSTCDHGLAAAPVATTTLFYSKSPWPTVESVAVDRLDLLVDVATRGPPAVPNTCTIESEGRRSR